MTDSNFDQKKQSLPISLLKLMRPKQWIKNGFVFAALVFSGNLLHLEPLLITIIGAIIFSLTASSVYIINDICDREKDRQHPKKCKRPIASGAVSIPQAVVLLVVLLAISFGVSLWMNIWFALVLLIYFLFNIIYSAYLKHIVIIDVICVSVSYVLRVVAGAVLILCPISPWIVVCTFFIALLIAIQKRRGELKAIVDGERSEGRKVLQQYSPELLRDMAVTMGAVTITAYCLYTFQSTTATWMICTIPFVIFGLLRYQFLSSKTGLGETPEDIVVHDKPMIVDLACWAIACFVIIYLL